MLLPVLLLLLGLLVQPVCACYTRTVMRHAAAETARVLATGRDDGVARSFALRRLGAVPEAAPFHVGGKSDWSVQLGRSDDGRSVSVRIAGHLRPLPLLGLTTYAFGTRDSVGLLMEERLEERVRPEWLGGDYGRWMQAW